VTGEIAGQQSEQLFAAMPGIGFFSGEVSGF
jgi:hypothetical protein